MFSQCAVICRRCAFAKGDRLIEEGVRADRLYVLKGRRLRGRAQWRSCRPDRRAGCFPRRDLQRCSAPAPTASVVAIRDSTVHVARRRVRRQCEPARAHLRHRAAAGAALCSRSRPTSWISSARMPDSDTHLGADGSRCLGNLMAAQPGAAIMPGFGAQRRAGLLKRAFFHAGERDPARGLLT